MRQRRRASSPSFQPPKDPLDEPTLTSFVESSHRIAKASASDTGVTTERRQPPVNPADVDDDPADELGFDSYKLAALDGPIIDTPDIDMPIIDPRVHDTPVVTMEWVPAYHHELADDAIVTPPRPVGRAPADEIPFPEIEPAPIPPLLSGVTVPETAAAAAAQPLLRWLMVAFLLGTFVGATVALLL